MNEKNTSMRNYHSTAEHRRQQGRRGSTLKEGKVVISEGPSH